MDTSPTKIEKWLRKASAVINCQGNVFQHLFQLNHFSQPQLKEKKIRGEYDMDMNSLAIDYPEKLNH